MTIGAYTSQEQAALANLVAQIIPASKIYNQPAADDPEIFADILTSGAELRLCLASALDYLMGVTAMGATKADAFRQAFPVEAELIQNLTVQCYYRDARVMRALNIEVRPPFPLGYAQEPNDLTLLDPVRAKGEIYRKAP